MDEGVLKTHLSASFAAMRSTLSTQDNRSKMPVRVISIFPFIKEYMKQLTKISRLLAIATCLSTTPLSYADTTMYKWVDKNGVVSFSEYEPGEKQAREVTTITVQTMPVTQQRAANRMLLNLSNAENTSFAAQQKRMQQADQAVEAALKQLQDAERNLTTGSIPTGFDRVGNINHRARLRESYFERVSDLQSEVDKARQVLNDAYAGRDQVSPD